MRRLYGLFIIVRALSPLLFLILFGLITWQTVREVQAISAPYVEQVNNSIDDIEATIATTQAAVTEVQDNIDQVAQTVDSIAESVTVDFGSIRLPISVDPFQLATSIANLLGLNIQPTLNFVDRTLRDTVDILGLGMVKDVFDDFADIMRDLATIAGISGVADNINSIIGTLQKLWGALAEVVARWGRWTALLLGALLLILVISYVEWLVRSLRRGWALFNGLPEPV